MSNQPTTGAQQRPSAAASNSNENRPGQQDMLDLLANWVQTALGVGLRVETARNDEQQVIIVRVYGVVVANGQAVVVANEGEAP